MSLASETVSPRPSRRLAAGAVLALGVTLLPGCSLLSINPAIELVKVGGAVVASTIATGPSKAKNSIYHEHGAIDTVCVEYNPTTADPEIPPALQQELKAHEIESRVYEVDSMPPGCRYRVSYTADIAWDVPPMGSGYQRYIREATLTLRDERGQVLASSAYGLDGAFQMGKWAPSRSKIAPMVTQLVTGFDR